MASKTPKKPEKKKEVEEDLTGYKHVAWTCGIGVFLAISCFTLLYGPFILADIIHIQPWWKPNLKDFAKACQDVLINSGIICSAEKKATIFKFPGTQDMTLFFTLGNVFIILSYGIALFGIDMIFNMLRAHRSQRNTVQW